LRLHAELEDLQGLVDDLDQQHQVLAVEHVRVEPLLHYLAEDASHVIDDLRLHDNRYQSIVRFHVDQVKQPLEQSLPVPEEGVKLVQFSLSVKDQKFLHNLSDVPNIDMLDQVRNDLRVLVEVVPKLIYRGTMITS
jgi:hypothetical protein